MIILGIDPGTRRVGYGAIEEKGKDLSHITHGVIETSTKKDRAENLLELEGRLRELLRLHQPSRVGVEKLFFAKNVKTAVGVSEARGVILLVLKQENIPFFELTPLEVKQSVTGHGAADKKQVQKMIRIILRLEEEPRPDDAADALAIAICCANRRYQYTNEY